MNKCPISYQMVSPPARYHQDALKQLAPKLTQLQPIAYTAQEQRQEAVARSDKMSVQGVQAKLSAVLSVKDQCFNIVDNHGKYIIKPQSDYYPELPENEDLTMRLAAMIGIETPLHGLVYSKDDSLSYFIKRFDRLGHHKKRPLEDFGQLTGHDRNTKYDYSMEKIIRVLDQYCTFPLPEKQKLFRLTLFNFLIGNEDMHLKNFSLIQAGYLVQLSPAYDLVNSSIALKSATEEVALTLNGKKRNLKQHDLLDYYGQQKLGLNAKLIDEVLLEIQNAIPAWFTQIEESFLSPAMQASYLALLNERLHRMPIFKI